MNNDEGTSSIPLFLNKVKSDKKAVECANILEACHPTHAQRLFLVGFLKFVGYSMAEVTNILHNHNHWCDYDVRVTSYQIGTIFKQKPGPTQNHTPMKARKENLTPLEVLKIRYQRSVTLSNLLRKENKNIGFPHPDRLENPEFNPSAEFLRK